MSDRTPDDAEAACAAALARLDAGAVAPPVALMEMLLAVPDLPRLRHALDGHAGDGAATLWALLASNEAGCVRIAAMLRSGVDTPPVGASVEEGVAFCRTLFDWSVGQSEEASVALYSLGDPGLLAEATDEIVALFRAYGVLGRSRTALDLGCGIGRLETALAGELGHLDAIDLSPAMIAAAQRRCASLSNVTFSVASGTDLATFADARFDLVVAVDSFPYVVQAGMALAETYFAEVGRVLRPGGDFLVLDFSYRGNLAADRADVARLAAAHGMVVLVHGESPFTLWNGKVFRLQRRA